MSDLLEDRELALRIINLNRAAKPFILAVKGFLCFCPNMKGV